MPKFHGRKKPYTSIGIGRVPCARCGQPSTYQWAVCANNGHLLGFCKACDIAMNAMVLAFVGFKNRDELLDWYIKESGYDGSHPAFTVHVPAVSEVGVDRDSVPDRDPDAAKRQAEWDRHS